VSTPQAAALSVARTRGDYRMLLTPLAGHGLFPVEGRVAKAALIYEASLNQVDGVFIRRE
jgi:hypothetical protein